MKPLFVALLVMATLQPARNMRLYLDTTATGLDVAHRDRQRSRYSLAYEKTSRPAPSTEDFPDSATAHDRSCLGSLRSNSSTAARAATLLSSTRQTAPVIGISMPSSRARRSTACAV